MPVIGPVLVHDATNTSGTGSLTLNNAAPAGRRGLADAVANGDAANGDQVYYSFEQASGSGGSLVFEAGKGTIADGGATLTRDVVFQSSNGGAKVDLPSGGTVDVVVCVLTEELLIAGNNLSELTSPPDARATLGVPGLNTANTITGEQVMVRSAAGIARALSLRNLQAANAANRSRADWVVNTDTNPRAAFRIDAGYSTIADGSRVSAVEFRADNAGVEAVVMAVAGHAVRDGAGNKFDAFPSGQVLLSESVPPGWTRSNEASDRLIKLATASDTLGATGGSGDPFGGAWSTQSHALTVSEIPSHNHQTVNGISTGHTQNAGGSATAYVPITSALNSGTNVTGFTGGGGGHSHVIATPRYRIMGRIIKS